MESSCGLGFCGRNLYRQSADHCRITAKEGAFMYLMWMMSARQPCGAIVPKAFVRPEWDADQNADMAFPDTILYNLYSNAGAAFQSGIHMFCGMSHLTSGPLQSNRHTSGDLFAQMAVRSTSSKRHLCETYGLRSTGRHPATSRALVWRPWILTQWPQLFR